MDGVEGVGFSKRQRLGGGGAVWSRMPPFAAQLGFRSNLNSNFREPNGERTRPACRFERRPKTIVPLSACHPGKARSGNEVFGGPPKTARQRRALPGRRFSAPARKTRVARARAKFPREVCGAGSPETEAGCEGAALIGAVFLVVPLFCTTGQYLACLWHDGEVGKAQRSKLKAQGKDQVQRFKQASKDVDRVKNAGHLAELIHAAVKHWTWNLAVETSLEL